MQTGVNLINEQCPTITNNVYHAEHHLEKRLCTFRLFCVKIKGNIGIPSMKSLQSVSLDFNVNDVAISRIEDFKDEWREVMSIYRFVSREDDEK